MSQSTNLFDECFLTYCSKHTLKDQASQIPSSRSSLCSQPFTGKAAQSPRHSTEAKDTLPKWTAVGTSVGIWVPGMSWQQRQDHSIQETWSLIFMNIWLKFGSYIHSGVFGPSVNSWQVSQYFFGVLQTLSESIVKHLLSKWYKHYFTGNKREVLCWGLRPKHGDGCSRFLAPRSSQYFSLTLSGSHSWL